MPATPRELAEIALFVKQSAESQGLDLQGLWSKLKQTAADNPTLTGAVGGAAIGGIGNHLVRRALESRNGLPRSSMLTNIALGGAAGGLFGGGVGRLMGNQPAAKFTIHGGKAEQPFEVNDTQVSQAAQAEAALDAEVGRGPITDMSQRVGAAGPATAGVLGGVQYLRKTLGKSKEDLKTSARSGAATGTATYADNMLAPMLDPTGTATPPGGTVNDQRFANLKKYFGPEGVGSKGLRDEMASGLAGNRTQAEMADFISRPENKGIGDKYRSSLRRGLEGEVSSRRMSGVLAPAAGVSVGQSLLMARENMRLAAALNELKRKQQIQ